MHNYFNSSFYIHIHTYIYLFIYRITLHCCSNLLKQNDDALAINSHDHVCSQDSCLQSAFWQLYLLLVFLILLLMILLNLKGTLRDLKKSGRAVTFDQTELVCILSYVASTSGIRKLCWNYIILLWPPDDTIRFFNLRILVKVKYYAFVLEYWSTYYWWI